MIKGGTLLQASNGYVTVENKISRKAHNKNGWVAIFIVGFLREIEVCA